MIQKQIYYFEYTCSRNSIKPICIDSDLEKSSGFNAELGSKRTCYFLPFYCFQRCSNSCKTFNLNGNSGSRTFFGRNYDYPVGRSRPIARAEASLKISLK
jgi:hypothetical protein